jgi:hypothetical protein
MSIVHFGAWSFGFGKPGGGSIPGLDLGNILWLPLESDIIDTTGNHTFTGDGELTTLGGKACYSTYGPTQSGGDGKSLLSQENPPADLPTTSAVTMACAMYLPSLSTAVVTSGMSVSEDISNRNYGLAPWYGSTVTSPLLLQGTANQSAYTLPADQTAPATGTWIHYALVFPAGRTGGNTCYFYENGSLRETVTMDAQAAQTGVANRVRFGADTVAWASSLGYRHALIADSELTAEQIGALSDAALA